jgi:hypothetical protein
MNEDYAKLKDFAKKRLDDSCGNSNDYDVRYWVGYIDGLNALHKKIGGGRNTTCKDCIHNEVCYMREVCNDIDEQIKEFGCMDFIARADVQKIKHGKWIEDGYCDIPCVCSCCGAEAQYTSTFKETLEYDCEENLCSTEYEETRKYIRTPFCPNCGAKMDGGNNNA